MKSILARFRWNDTVFECSVNYACNSSNSFIKEFDKAALISTIDFSICKLLPTARLIDLIDDGVSKFNNSFTWKVNHLILQIYTDSTYFEAIEKKFSLSNTINLDCYHRYAAKRAITIGNKSCILNIDDNYLNLSEPISLVRVNLEINKSSVTLYLSSDSLQKLIALFKNEVSTLLAVNNSLQVEMGLTIFTYYLHLIGFETALLNWQVISIKPCRMIKINIVYEQILWLILFEDSQLDIISSIFEKVGMLNQSVINLSLIETTMKLPYKVITKINGCFPNALNNLKAGDIILSNQLKGNEEYFIDFGKTQASILPSSLQELKINSKVII